MPYEVGYPVKVPNKSLYLEQWINSIIRQSNDFLRIPKDELQ